MRYRLLGPVEVAGDDGTPVALTGEHERVLLAVLLLNANQVVSASRLIIALWEDDPPATAANALQAQVSRLRKKLAAGSASPGPLRSAPYGYMLVVGPGELDVQRFEQLTGADGGDAREISGRLGEALGLCRGPALVDVRADALAGEAARLDELRLVALERRIEADLALGRHAQLVPELEALVHDQPLREGLRGQLMVALYRSGRQADALSAYQQGRAVLAEQLGIDPGPALQRLEVAILQQAPEIAAPAIPGESVGDPGEPAGRLAGPQRRHNLPQQLSSFIGREAEIAALGRLVAAHRLTTVVGVAGVGKTRLALQATAGLVDGGDGVWLVELASLRHPDLVANRLAEAIGVPEQPGRAMLDTLVDALGARRLLVVLDNCEHLAEPCAELVEALLHRCPGVCVLATSREPLGVEGEHVFRLAPLPIPAAGDETLGVEDIAKYDAVELFVERASAQRADFALDDVDAAAVAATCRHLDGIPLAIELAAARLRSLSISDIDARLADRFRLLTGGSRTLPRHRTLKALIDWSYELLTPAEQAVLRRLSVFAGGWRLDAAEQVCAGGAVAEAQVADCLGALVDKSLAEMEPRGGAARYRLLETIRQYAAERLAEAGEDNQVRRCHARAYLALTEAAAAPLRGPTQLEWLARIDEDLDNIRVAGATLLAAADGAEEALRLVAAQRWYWDIRAHCREGIAFAEAALDLPDAATPTLLRAHALVTLLFLPAWFGEVFWDRSRAEEAMAIARAHDDVATIVDLLILHIFNASNEGDSGPAVRAMAHQSIELARRSGDPHLLARALTGSPQGFGPDKRDLIIAFNREAVAAFRTIGDRHWLAGALNNLASSEIDVGDLSLARAHLDEAIPIAAQLLGGTSMLSTLLFNSGLAAVLQGDLDSACKSFSDSFTVADRTGTRFMHAEAILGLALCASRSGDAHRAASLHGTSQALLDQLGQMLQPLEARIAEENRSKLRHDLGPDVFETAFDSGYQLGTTWWQTDTHTRAAAIFAPQRPVGPPRRPIPAIP